MLYERESDLDDIAKLVVRSNVLGQRRTRPNNPRLGPTRFDCKIADQVADLLGTTRENVLWEVFRELEAEFSRQVNGKLPSPVKLSLARIVRIDLMARPGQSEILELLQPHRPSTTSPRDANGWPRSCGAGICSTMPHETKRETQASERSCSATSASNEISSPAEGQGASRVDELTTLGIGNLLDRRAELN